MPQIEISAIKRRPSSSFTSDHSINCSRHSSQSSSNITIPPLFSSFSQSSSTTRRRSLFCEFDVLHSQNNEETLAMAHHKPHFKVPVIDSYYTKHQRENIHPNKMHRIESTIESRKEQKTPLPIIEVQMTEIKKQTKQKKTWWPIFIFFIMVASLTTFAL